MAVKNYLRGQAYYHLGDAARTFADFSGQQTGVPLRSNDIRASSVHANSRNRTLVGPDLVNPNSLPSIPMRGGIRTFRNFWGSSAAD